jgi:hypothetical protein
LYDEIEISIAAEPACREADLRVRIPSAYDV